MLSATHPAILIEKLNAEYEDSWIEWLPETLKSAIDSRWGGIDDVNFDKLLSIRNLINHGFFWHDVDVFEATVNALNYADVNHSLGIKPSPAQIAFAVSEVLQVVDKELFNDDVLQYIAMIFADRGHIYMPERFNLDGVQGYLDDYFNDENLKLAVKTKWEEMMDGSYFDLSETIVDIKLAKLLTIKKFIDMNGSGQPREKNQALLKLILD